MEEIHIHRCGMFHSDSTVVVLLQKYFSSWHRNYCNSISIITDYTHSNMSKSNVTAYVNNLPTFFKFAYYI